MLSIKLTESQISAILDAIDLCKSDYAASLENKELSKSAHVFLRRLTEVENKLFKANKETPGDLAALPGVKIQN